MLKIIESGGDMNSAENFNSLGVILSYPGDLLVFKARNICSIAIELQGEKEKFVI